jgi:hypothetical protein
MAKQQTIISIRHLSTADDSIKITVRSPRGEVTWEQLSPGEEILIQLEIGEELSIAGI